PMIAPPGLPLDGVAPAPNTAVPPGTIDDSKNYRPNQLPLPTGTAPNMSNRGTVVVKLPTDARLFAEGRALTLVGAERTFITPELPLGREYEYTFKIEYDRAGETISSSKKVRVTPGKMASLEFIDYQLKADATKSTSTSKSAATTPAPAKPTNAPVYANFMPSSTSSERARLSVKVPAGATLFIDGKENKKTGELREFSTPPLPAGREFKYVMTVQLQRNGLPESITEEVVFRAGEIVPTRDFTALFQAKPTEQRAGR
ncbi:MAG: TIGR03000 domain-containing protein, partial [Gemmataceae bacterium]